MRYYLFTVQFETGYTCEVYALNKEEATILAQAVQIQAGRGHSVESIKREN